jgi:hypothetical protein
MTRETEVAIDQLKSLQEMVAAEITAYQALIDELRDIATPFSGIVIERSLRVHGVVTEAGMHHHVKKDLITSETIVGLSTVSGKPPKLSKIIIPKAA